MNILSFIIALYLLSINSSGLNGKEPRYLHLLSSQTIVKQHHQAGGNVKMSYIEKDLSTAFNKINACMDSSDKYSEKDDNVSINKMVRYAADSVIRADSLFELKLLFYTSHYPKTITYGFKLLGESLGIITSSDSLFRIYTWDDMLGGTERFSDNVFQYSCDGKVRSCKLRSDGKHEGMLQYITDNFSYIYMIQSGGNKFYLTTFEDKESTGLGYEGIMAFTINEKGLNTARIIKTKTGLKNEIGYSYNFFSGNSEDSIHFNEDTKNIYLPIVVSNKEGEGRKTNKYIIYHFNGNFFERIQN